MAKLEWAKHGQSERQLRDVTGILNVSGPTLDIDRIETWVEALGLTVLWESVHTAKSD